MSSKSVLQECQVRVSSKKGVLQECHLSVSRQGVPQVGSLENVISIVSVLQHTCRHSGSWASSCFYIQHLVQLSIFIPLWAPRASPRCHCRLSWSSRATAWSVASMPISWLGWLGWEMPKKTGLMICFCSFCTNLSHKIWDSECCSQKRVAWTCMDIFHHDWISWNVSGIA